jgi:hypothetical protein
MVEELDRTREQRLRRAANRQGFRLVKSRSRDPRAIDWGCYMIVRLDNDTVEAGTGGIGRPSFSLDDVERFLTEE